MGRQFRFSNKQTQSQFSKIYKLKVLQFSLYVVVTRNPPQ